MEDSNAFVSRRAFFKAGSVLSLGAWATNVAYATGVITPGQTEGPFYPVKDQPDKDIDLTRVVGRSQPAIGSEEPIIVKGTVTDVNGIPIAGAIIDVWQACASGKYDHPLDENPAPLDPNFQYWAKFKTNSRGEYKFKTIKPGAYPATNNWIRPPHIHFRVDAWGHGRLTTQMYFHGEELNSKDDILLDTLDRYGQEAHDSLIVQFNDDNVAEAKIGAFNIVLGKGKKATPAVD